LKGNGKTLAFLHLGGLIGFVFLAMNLFGFFMPLRSPEIGVDYADFSRIGTLSANESLRRLQLLSESNKEKDLFLNEATRIFHQGIAHVPKDDIEKKGLDYYRMRVPVWENFVLYFLSYVKPDTYMDYEFCSYRKALERGTGRCGQQVMALVDYLSKNEIETGFISLGGHAIATAKSGDGVWHMLDPDYGGAVPFDLKTAEKNPASVIPHYWSPAIVRNNMARLYAPENNTISYGGVDARFERACKIEVASYLIKWLAPSALIFVWGISLVGIWRSETKSD
jgi:hypothetical protein